MNIILSTAPRLLFVCFFYLGTFFWRALILMHQLVKASPASWWMPIHLVSHWGERYWPSIEYLTEFYVKDTFLDLVWCCLACTFNEVHAEVWLTNKRNLTSNESKLPLNVNSLPILQFADLNTVTYSSSVVGASKWSTVTKANGY